MSNFIEYQLYRLWKFVFQGETSGNACVGQKGFIVRAGKLAQTLSEQSTVFSIAAFGTCVPNQQYNSMNSVMPR